VSRQYRDARVIARTAGAAIAWHLIALDAAQSEVSLKLAPEEPLTVRLMDREGQPAADVRVAATTIVSTVSADPRPERLVNFHQDGQAPAAWIEPLTSDPQGRLTFHGIATGQGVWLDVAGNDQLAPQTLGLNTGLSEGR